MGYVNLGNQNNSTWHNAKGGMDWVQYIALAISVTNGVASLGAIGITALKTSGGLTTTLKGIYKALPATSGECGQAAKLALDAFQKAGKSGEILTVTNAELTKNLGAGRGLLLNQAGEVVSNTNFHQVVRVGDKFYDSLTGAKGATWDRYLKLWHPDTAATLTASVGH